MSTNQELNQWIVERDKILTEWMAQFAQNVLNSEQFKKELSCVTTGSDYVFEHCMSTPEKIISLWNSGDLKQEYDNQTYQEKLIQLNRVGMSVDEWNSVLRAFRHREMIRIIWRDINEFAALEETLADLSNLADACLLITLNYIQETMRPVWGLPCDKAGKVQNLQIIAMGKLGGQELNLSSDIDLVFTYPEEGETQGGEQTINNQVYFIKLTQQLIQILNRVTVDGFVFRVDTRLRPYGESGPLVIPFSSLKNYFINSARLWERYAFIKARILAGDAENNQRLEKLIHEFTYQTASDKQIMQTLKSIKEKICEQVIQQSMQQNIKLGSGGIREIEFVVQVFQLIYGSEDITLRGKNLIKTLQLLWKNLYLKPDAATNLLKAYYFLRELENRIQSFADKQTHDLPMDELQQARLAKTLGYADWAELLTEINKHRKLVSKKFSKLTEQSFAEISVSKAKALRNIKFEQQLVLTKELQAWQIQYTELAQFNTQHWKEFTEKLINSLLVYPEQKTILSHLLKLLTAIIKGNILPFDQLNNYLEKLVQLCRTSNWFIDAILQHPILLKEGLTQPTLLLPTDPEGMRLALEKFLSAQTNIKNILPHLIKFKMEYITRIALADILAILPVMQVSDRLTDLACIILQKIMHNSWLELCNEYGRPKRINGERCELDFIIVGYGKLGGIELGYTSDLDLVFLHDADEQALTDGANPISGAQFYQRLAKRIMEDTTIQTEAGRLYAIDTRLKPMGQAGLLVNSFNGFTHYQKQNAWTWEHQALVRARPIAGDEKLAQQFRQLREKILSLPRDIYQLRKDILDMRERMRNQQKIAQGAFHLKHDAGGMTDIEFLAQYVVLAWSQRQPLLTMFPDNIRIFETCESAGLLSRKTVDALCNAYRDLRRFYHHRALQDKSGLVGNNRFVEQRAAVQKVWHFLLESQAQ